MLTSAEVCAQLRIGEKTLRRMIADGQIEAIKVGGGRWGGTYRITEEALAQYIERQTVEAPA
jgi:excisionase family DNA binding protein